MDGLRIFAAKARFERRWDDGAKSLRLVRLKKAWRRNDSLAYLNSGGSNNESILARNNLVHAQSGQESISIIHGEIDGENEEWLSRSIVDKLINFFNVQDILAMVFKELLEVFHVRELGVRKVLITFVSTDAMHKALACSKGVIHNVFSDIKPWSEREEWQSSRVWLECYGISPQAWSYSNICKIGEIWGIVICLDKSTKNMESFCVARILVETCFRHVIQGWVYLTLGGKGKGCDVYVREGGASFFGPKSIGDGTTPQAVTKKVSPSWSEVVILG